MPERFRFSQNRQNRSISLFEPHFRTENRFILLLEMLEKAAAENPRRPGVIVLAAVYSAAVLIAEAS